MLGQFGVDRLVACSTDAADVLSVLERFKQPVHQRSQHVVKHRPGNRLVQGIQNDRLEQTVNGKSGYSAL